MFSLLLKELNFWILFALDSTFYEYKKALFLLFTKQINKIAAIVYIQKFR